jgi:hypothetical protein
VIAILNVKEISMKRIIPFLSLIFVFSTLAFSQTAPKPMGPNCPMTQQGSGKASCKKCCKGDCAKMCSKGDCAKMCADGNCAKMCSKDKCGKKCCQKGSAMQCCKGGSKKGAEQPATGAESTGSAM